MGRRFREHLRMELWTHGLAGRASSAVTSWGHLTPKPWFLLQRANISLELLLIFLAWVFFQSATSELSFSDTQQLAKRRNLSWTEILVPLQYA